LREGNSDEGRLAEKALECLFRSLEINQSLNGLGVIDAKPEDQIISVLRAQNVEIERRWNLFDEESKRGLVGDMAYDNI
jgi:hypothetical protein